MKMASGPSLSACPQARFHPRLINAAEADPYSRAAGIAASESTRMSAQHRRSVYVAAVGRHENANRIWRHADDSEIADAIARGANDGETVKRLIEALPADRRAASVASSLHRIVTTDRVDDRVVAAVAAYGMPEGLQAAADAALAANTACGFHERGHHPSRLRRCRELAPPRPLGPAVLRLQLCIQGIGQAQ